jgi:hypothetical protein
MNRFRSLCTVVVFAALAASLPSAADAAPDLTGLSVSVDYLFPNTSTIFSHDSVMVGAGNEITCPDAATQLCTDIFDPFDVPTSVDLSSDTVFFSNLQSLDYGAAAAFSGLSFSGLAGHGPWGGFTLDTNFIGLTASDVSLIGGDVLRVNLQGIQFPGGEGGGFFSITLRPAAVPEPGFLPLLGLGLSAVAVRARTRRRTQP